jgi:hypothetical protein
MVRYGGKSAFPHSMMAQKISHIEKNLDTTSFTRRDAYKEFCIQFYLYFYPFQASPAAHDTILSKK